MCLCSRAGCPHTPPHTQPTLPSTPAPHTATMQTLKRSVAATAPVRAQKPMVVRGAVRCQASQKQLAQKAAAALVSVPTLLAASPAFALVDDRLNGDGVGYALGVSDPALGWVIGGVASLIWILYFVGQKDFGDFEDKDSGIGL